MSFVFQTKKIGKYGREFSANVELGQNQIESYTRPISMSYSEAIQKSGRQVTNMVWDLMRISGVRLIFIEPYKVTVYMESVFEWNNDIDERVRQAFIFASGNGADNELRVKKFPNTQLREYSSNVVISNKDYARFARPYNDRYNNDLDDIGLKGARLVRELLKVPGITQVTVNKRSILVEIGIAFEWENVENSIKDSFENATGQAHLYFNHQN